MSIVHASVYISNGEADTRRKIYFNDNTFIIKLLRCDSELHFSCFFQIQTSL